MLKMKVLSRVRRRERGDGSTIFLFDGITSDSHLVHCSVQNQNMLDKIGPQKYLIIKKYLVSASSSSSDIYVTLQDGMVSLKH